MGQRWECCLQGHTLQREEGIALAQCSSEEGVVQMQCSGVYGGVVLTEHLGVRGVSMWCRAQRRRGTMPGVVPTDVASGGLEVGQP